MTNNEAVAEERLPKHRTVELPAAPVAAARILDTFLRRSAQELFARILVAESERYLERHAAERDAMGREAVVRNGYQPQRAIGTGIGPVSVRFPKLRSRTSSRAAFRSNVVPRYVRRTCELESGAAWRYLNGIFHRDLGDVLVALLGPKGAALSKLVPPEARIAWSGECGIGLQGSLADASFAQVRPEYVAAGTGEGANSPGFMAVLGLERNGTIRLLALEPRNGESPAAHWATVFEELSARGLKLPAREAQHTYTTIDADCPAGELYA